MPEDSNPPVLVERGPVTTVRLNRPDKFNAMTVEMGQALSALVPELNADRGVRVVVLRGAGKAFCAGGDFDMLELVPSAEIANDPGNVWDLQRGDLNLGPAEIETGLASLNNDALVVLHRGRLVHESYRNGMGPDDPHILMSVSKSMLGLLAGTLVERGELDLNAPLTEYVPELAGTAYAGATVRNGLDMRVGIAFDEDYFLTEGPIIDYRYAANWNPLPPGRDLPDLRSFQLTLRDRDGEHGGCFHYVSPVTDLLAWVFERATGRRYADLFSERIWRPLGAERPGYITVDRIGGARAAGGMCLTARDLARIGQMMLQGGAREGIQVVPESWLVDIATSGSTDAWRQGDFYEDFGKREMFYRSKWYVRPDEDVLIYGIGIHGQYLFVDPRRELSVAMFSSEATPSDDAWTARGFALVERIRASVG